MGQGGTGTTHGRAAPPPPSTVAFTAPPGVRPVPQPLAHEAGEMLTSGRVATVRIPVEAGASRREEDDVSGPGRSARLRRRHRPSTRPSSPVRRRRTRRRCRPPPRRSPRRPDPRRLGCHRAQVEALVQPAGDQHDMVEPTDRGRRGVRGRGLGVVEPLHAVGVADELDAVRRAREGRQGGRRPRPASTETGLEDEGRRGEPVGESCGSDRRRLATGASGPVGPASCACDPIRRPGSRHPRGRTSAAAPGAVRRCAITIGSSTKPIATSDGRC